jgi:hypothetical protein
VSGGLGVGLAHQKRFAAALGCVERATAPVPRLALDATSTPNFARHFSPGDPSAKIPGMEFAHVKLSGDRAGEYVVTEERPDGSLTLVPDTSFEAIRKRLGTEPGTLADFEAEYGPVQPPDGEG